MTDPLLSLPPASTLSTLPETAITKVLSLLFEPSPALSSLITPLIRAADPSTADYRRLITATNAQLHALTRSSRPEDIQLLSAILSSHPRLGAKVVGSTQSRAEQTSLNSALDDDDNNNNGSDGQGRGKSGHEDDDDKTEDLALLNQRYEDLFPGLRYVVFVNGRSRAEIVCDMRARIQKGDIVAERATAIDAMCDIALDRAGKLQRTPQ